MPVASSLVDQWADPQWRIRNLYYIRDENGKEVHFVPNEEQEQFLREYWYYNVILKARQLGFTTLIDLLILDQCFFVPNMNGGIIAHNLDDASNIFRNKVKYAHDMLPEALRRNNPLVKQSESELQWANGSQIRVGTSMRSGTLQYLHVSEMGKIARKFPEKSREILSGSLNAIHSGNFVFVESTAEGRGGDFHSMVTSAKKLQDGNQKLTDMDFKLHFYPWWKKKEYRLDPTHVLITREHEDYFAELRDKHGIKLDARQKAWYVKKLAQQGSWELMKQEFPGHADEAFEAANEEKYFGKQMVWLRKNNRIREIPILLERPVNTLWDIGQDMTSIWFHQFIAGEHRLIDFYQNSGEELSHYLKILQDRPYLYGTFLLPHDAKDKGIDVSEDRTTFARVKLAYRNSRVVAVPRTPNKGESINRARSFLRQCWFHAINCDQGITCVESYRKKWNDKTGMWMDEPFHDKNSHASDSFMQLSDGWKPEYASGAMNGLPAGFGASPAVGDREAGY